MKESRERREKNRARLRFWDMAGSKMGAITGLTEEEQAAAAKLEAEVGGPGRGAVAWGSLPRWRASDGVPAEPRCAAPRPTPGPARCTRGPTPPQKAAAGEGDDGDGDTRADSQFLSHLKKKTEAASEFSRTKTIAQQRRSLPVYQVREDLLQVGGRAEGGGRWWGSSRCPSGGDDVGPRVMQGGTRSRHLSPLHTHTHHPPRAPAR